MRNEERIFLHIKKSLLNICSNRKESLQEIIRYYESFPDKIDYNIITYGNLLTATIQIAELYKKYKYKFVESASVDQLWTQYLFDVGWVVDNMILKDKIKP